MQHTSNLSGTFQGNVYNNCTFNTRSVQAPRSESPSLLWQKKPSWVPDDDPSMPRLRTAAGGVGVRLKVHCCNNSKSTCKRSDPEMFAPVQSHTDRQAYVDALAAYNAAVDAEDPDALLAARAEIGKWAVKKCMPCRESIARTQKKPQSACVVVRRDVRVYVCVCFNECFTNCRFGPCALPGT